MGTTSPSSRQINKTPETCNAFDVNVSPSRQPRASHEGHQGIFKITLLFFCQITFIMTFKTLQKPKKSNLLDILYFKYLPWRSLKLFRLVSRVPARRLLRNDGPFFGLQRRTRDKKEKRKIMQAVPLPPPRAADSLQPLEGRRTQPYVRQVDFLSL